MITLCLLGYMSLTKQWTYLRERDIVSCRTDSDKYRPQGINQNSLEMRMNLQSHCCNKWQYFRILVKKIEDPFKCAEATLTHTLAHPSDCNTLPYIVAFSRRLKRRKKTSIKSKQAQHATEG